MFLFLNSVHSHHRNISKRLFSLKLNNDVRILPMPRLSPTMKKGTIKKWFLSQGDQVKSYQLILEVSTSELTKDSLETAKEFTMEIEILEEMYLVKKLGIEGKEYSVGECIGLFSDEEKYITQYDSLKVNHWLKYFILI